MTRTRATAKQAGAKFERSTADYLADALGDDGVDRRVKTGAKDCGDIGGVRLAIRLRPAGSSGRVVIECKDHAGVVKVKPWLDEAEIERGNDDAAVGVVIAKRRGIGNPAEQLVMMTVADLVCLLTGERPAAL